MKLEEAFNKVNKIRIDFFDSKYKDVHTEDELAEKYEALGTILQYIKYDSIPKKKVKDLKEELEEIKSQYILKNTNYINELQYAIDILQELLEDK